VSICAQDGEGYKSALELLLVAHAREVGLVRRGAHRRSAAAALGRAACVRRHCVRRVVLEGGVLQSVETNEWAVCIIGLYANCAIAIPLLGACATISPTRDAAEEPPDKQLRDHPRARRSRILYTAA
jgi:hypothetical protein